MDFHEGSYRLNESYVKALLQAGGLPVSLPFTPEKEMDQFLATIDGLLLTGGGDINPLLFGEEPQLKLGKVLTERDEYEIQWTKKALQHNIPILGICRGLQILNVALGGTLYQDIYSQSKRDRLLHAQTSPRHETSHYVQLKENSKLHKMFKETNILVNSFHHQAIKDIANNLQIIGQAKDGIIEAVEHKTASFCIGVQWHPEELVAKGEKNSMKLFEEFVAACTLNKT